MCSNDAAIGLCAWSFPLEAICTNRTICPLSIETRRKALWIGH